MVDEQTTTDTVPVFDLDAMLLRLAEQDKARNEFNAYCAKRFSVDPAKVRRVDVRESAIVQHLTFVSESLTGGSDTDWVLFVPTELVKSWKLCR